MNCNDDDVTLLVPGTASHTHVCCVFGVAEDAYAPDGGIVLLQLDQSRRTDERRFQTQPYRDGALQVQVSSEDEWIQSTSDPLVTIHLRAPALCGLFTSSFQTASQMTSNEGRFVYPW